LEDYMKKLDEVVAAFQADETARTLSGLEPREIELLKAKFGVETETGIVDAVREQMAIPGERLRLMKEKAARKLKYPSRIRHLASYLDGTDTKGEK
jgi:DNA-directed RNA polymerase sigma subunit (sigma70/sigma32)